MNYSMGNKKKMPLFVKLLIAAVVVIVIGLYVLGATLGSNSEERQAVNSAVEENVQLKQEAVKKDDRIEELTAMIEELEAELDAIPSPSPTPYAPEATPSASPQPSPQARSPR